MTTASRPRARARRTPAHTITTPRELTWRNRQELKQQALDAIAAGAKDLVLDFARTQVIDASGYGVLVSVRKLVRDRGGLLTLTNLNRELLGHLERTRLAELFHIMAAEVPDVR